jgi:hypothetical protein
LSRLPNTTGDPAWRRPRAAIFLTSLTIASQLS